MLGKAQEPNMNVDAYRSEIPMDQTGQERLTTITNVAMPQPVVYFGPDSQQAVCPYCRIHMKTKVKSKATSKTHCWACLLLSCCLCCIPHCCNSCQNRVHYCAMCNAVVGVYQS